MMILSRIWYLVLAIVAAVAMYMAYLAVGQYNRQSVVATDEALRSDAQVVGWALQIDGRRRLESLVFASNEPNIRKSLKDSNTKDAVSPASREEAKRGLAAVNEKLPSEFKFEALFAVDREGRVVGQIGYDAASATENFELGGYPAVFDGLHGYLRDDTWVFGNRVFRVFVRPVEDEVGNPPLGAVVALKGVDNEFAKEIAKRTRSNLAFYLGDQKVGSAASQDTLPAEALDDVTAALPSLKDDEGYKAASGRTDIKPFGSKGASAIFSKLTGEAGELRAGFAVIRQRTVIAGIGGFLTRADDSDKKNVNYIVLAALLLLGAGLGMLFIFLEHSKPLKELSLQGERLRKGEGDAFQLQKLSAAYRSIGADLNQGIERLLERGGSTRKPADLESILGPVPAQPNMSAFSFPLPESSTAAFPPSGNSAAVLPAPAPSAAGPLGPPPRIVPPAPKSAPFAPPLPKPAGLVSPPSANSALSDALDLRDEDDREDETRVGAAPKGLIAASVKSEPPPPMSASNDPVEWKSVYEEFVQVKRQCGEPVDGLTYEKFRGTLAKNRDALMQRHNCSRVKFTVYVKDGRASLKATPVRD
jgi:hypothetical protein